MVMEAERYCSLDLTFLWRAGIDIISAPEICFVFHGRVGAIAFKWGSVILVPLALSWVRDKAPEKHG